MISKKKPFSCRTAGRRSAKINNTVRCLIKTCSKGIFTKLFYLGSEEKQLILPASSRRFACVRQPGHPVWVTVGVSRNARCYFCWVQLKWAGPAHLHKSPLPPNTAPTSEENLVHLGWQLKESQRKANRQRTDVQEEKHEKRWGAIDVRANALQHLRTIKATSATVAVHFLRVREGRCALSRVCSCDLSSRPPSQFRINCQNCPGGRRLSGHMNIKRNEERKNIFFFFYYVFVVVHQKGSCPRH